MIVVVEGASAAGKTTWCRTFASGRVLFEGEPIAGTGPAGASDFDPVDPTAVAKYWTQTNAQRWQAARAMSERLGWMACDTDPFKLHWTWALWSEGFASQAYWDASRDLAREAFAARTLGLADLILFADVDAWTLRHQKANDPTRSRSRHETHIRIAPALKRWYRAMATLDPARVKFDLPIGGLDAGLLSLGPRPERTGAAEFDRFMDALQITR